MGVNRKILVVGTVVIGLVFLFCSGFSFFCYLKEPVFLYHYIETPVYNSGEGYGDSNLTLYYITNASDTREVNYITFDEAPEIIFYAGAYNGMRDISDVNYNPNTLYNPNVSQRVVYGRYQLKKTNIYYDSSQNNFNFDELYLSKATIKFDNGDEIHTDLGEIVLYKYEEDDQAIHSISSSSSSDGTEAYEYEVENTVKLESMDSPLLEKVNDYVNLRINDTSLEDIKGLKVEKGSRLKISTEFIKPSKSIPFLTVYDLKPKVTYVTEEGKSRHYTRYYGIHYSPDNNSLTFLNLFQYVTARGLL